MASPATATKVRRAPREPGRYHLTMLYSEPGGAPFQRDIPVSVAMDDQGRARIEKASSRAEVDALAQLIEYATQDADPKVFEPLRGPFNERAAAYKQLLLDTEPKHLEALLGIAARAYRRTLMPAEANDLRARQRTIELRILRSMINVALWPFVRRSGRGETKLGWAGFAVCYHWQIRARGNAHLLRRSQQQTPYQN